MENAINDEANNENRKYDGGDCCLEILIPDKCYQTEAESAWDNPFLNRKIFLFCY